MLGVCVLLVVEIQKTQKKKNDEKDTIKTNIDFILHYTRVTVYSKIQNKTKV